MGFGAPDFSSGMFLVRQDVGLWGIRDWQAKELEVKYIHFSLVDFPSGSYEWDTVYTVPSGKIAYISDYVHTSSGKAYVVWQVQTSSGGTKFFVSAAHLYLQNVFGKAIYVPPVANADENIVVFTRNDDTVDITVIHVMGFFETFGSHPVVPKKLSAYVLWRKGLFTNLSIVRKGDITIVEVTPLWGRNYKFTVKGPLRKDSSPWFDEPVKVIELDKMIKFLRKKGYELER